MRLTPHVLCTCILIDVLTHEEENDLTVEEKSALTTLLQDQIRGYDERSTTSLGSYYAVVEGAVSEEAAQALYGHSEELESIDDIYSFFQRLRDFPSNNQIEPSSVVGLYLRNVLVLVTKLGFDGMAKLFEEWCAFKAEGHSRSGQSAQLTVEQAEYILDKHFRVVEECALFGYSIPNSVMEDIAIVERNAQNSTRLQYIKYLVSVHRKDFVTAIDNLHRYFDQCIGDLTDVEHLHHPILDSPNVSEADIDKAHFISRMNKSCFRILQYAALQLGILYYQFRMHDSAVEALTEAVRIAQTNGDQDCLGQVLSWLTIVENDRNGPSSTTEIAGSSRVTVRKKNAGSLGNASLDTRSLLSHCVDHLDRLKMSRSNTCALKEQAFRSLAVFNVSHLQSLHRLLVDVHTEPIRTDDPTGGTLPSGVVSDSLRDFVLQKVPENDRVTFLLPKYVEGPLYRAEYVGMNGSGDGANYDLTHISQLLVNAHVMETFGNRSLALAYTVLAGEVSIDCETKSRVLQSVQTIRKAWYEFDRGDVSSALEVVCSLVGDSSDYSTSTLSTCAEMVILLAYRRKCLARAEHMVHVWKALLGSSREYMSLESPPVWHLRATEAMVYMARGKLERARELCLSIVQDDIQSAPPMDIVNAFLVLAQCYIKMGSFSEADFALIRARGIASKLALKGLVAITTLHIGMLECAEEKWERAASTLQSCGAAVHTACTTVEQGLWAYHYALCSFRVLSTATVDNCQHVLGLLHTARRCFVNSHSYQEVQDTERLTVEVFSQLLQDSSTTTEQNARLERARAACAHRVEVYGDLIRRELSDTGDQDVCSGQRSETLRMLSQEPVLKQLVASGRVRALPVPDTNTARAITHRDRDRSESYGSPMKVVAHQPSEDLGKVASPQNLHTDVSAISMVSNSMDQTVESVDMSLETSMSLDDSEREPSMTQSAVSAVSAAEEDSDQSGCESDSSCDMSIDDSC